MLERTNPAGKGGAWQVTSAAQIESALNRQTLREWQAEVSRADLMLASIHDAARHAELVAYKLRFVGAVLQHQHISSGMAANWIFKLDLHAYVTRPEFAYEVMQ